MVRYWSCSVTEAPDLVIGSGPAGVSVALALLTRGRRVVMLDGGKRLEPEAEARRQALAAVPLLTDGDREAWRARQYDGPPGQVRRYGSDFAMEAVGETFADAGGLELRSSRAVGGLSTLWGAAVLPYAARDIAEWPVGIEALVPHYRAVAGLMPVSGRVDDLAAVLPAFSMAGAGQIAPSVQAGLLLDRLGRVRDRLAAQGIFAGAARHAVSDCKRCGLCLHGCPYGFIWSARAAVDGLIAKGMTHRTGVVVRVEETDAGVRLHLAGGETVAGARVFVAAGVLETARILMASGGAAEMVMADSLQAFLPMLHRWRSPTRPDLPPHHTLPQVFVEIDHREVSPRLVHGQIYSWNEYFLRDLQQNYGRKLPGSGPLWAAMARRLMVAQLFLHSDHSPRIALRQGAGGRLVARVVPAADSGRVMQAALRVMGRAMGLAGLSALSFASRTGGPGASFHTGGTVPMAVSPRAGQSDILGRPYGLSRVHLVDSSVFPSIPATTITFSVMANAHRIGMSA